LEPGVKRSYRCPPTANGDPESRDESARLARIPEDQHTAGPVAPQSGTGWLETMQRHRGNPLLEKLAQLARFGLGAEDPPLLEPVRKRS
jgi:hypothetical protein